MITNKSYENICGYGAVSSFMEYTGAVDDNDDDGDDVVDECDEEGDEGDDNNAYGGLEEARGEFSYILKTSCSLFDCTTFISSRPRTPKIHLRGERQVTRFVINMEKSGYLQNKRQNNKAKQNDKTKKQ